MIPKIIHYCWFGGEKKPKLMKKCIASWKRYCPEYEFREWNENTFDVSKYPYAQYCFKNKKYAFLSDFVRLAVVYEYGGIYLDSDVELIKSLDDFIKYEAFYGFENAENINTGHGFGAVKGHETVRCMRQYYLKLKEKEDGSFPVGACPEYNTKALIPLGLKLDGTRQQIAGAEIFPVEYLNPYDDQCGRLNKTENTVAIHWYSKSWLSKTTIIRSKITKPFHRIFGVDCFDRFKQRGKS